MTDKPKDTPHTISEPDHDPRAYHPHREDGLDTNLTRVNAADYLEGYRCNCPMCVRAFGYRGPKDRT
jgi:hypothetical protein